MSAMRHFYATKLIFTSVEVVHIYLLTYMGCQEKNLISPIRDVQHLAEALSIPDHLIHYLPALIIMRGADDKLFHLEKSI